MEVTLTDKIYRVGKLNAFSQLYVFKRLSPMLPALAVGFGGLGALAEKEKDDEDIIPLTKLADAFNPVIDTFAKLPDEDMDFILKTCLAVVHVQDGKEWHPVVSNGQIMYDTIEAADMMALVYYCVRDEIANFTQKTVTNLFAAG